MDDFVGVRGLIPKTLEEGLADALSHLQVLGVQIESAETEMIDVTVWLRGGDTDLIEGTRSVLLELGSESVDARATAAEDWSAKWRENLVAFEVGQRWWIDPLSDPTVGVPDGRIRLAVVPRAAFGSGTHETTRLILMELESHGCDGIRVLDVGTGSGILAVAADRLGAASVVALDNDCLAVWEARATAALQDWMCRPVIVAGSVDCLGDAAFDLVLCNMIVSHFEPILDEIRRILAPGGSMILAGMLEHERNSVVSMLEGLDLAVAEERVLGEWIGIRADRMAGT